MKTREVSVIGRTVYGNGEVELIRTSVGIDQMHVLFDSAEWVAFGAVSVTFKNSADTENPITTSITPTAIDSPDWSAEATCLIPWEVIQDIGDIAVTFQATDSSSNHIITARAESVLSVIEAGDVNEGTVPSTAPTLSEWEQAYADTMAAASSAANAAEQISDILGSTDAQTLEELIAALGSALRYKGSVSTYADLPEDAEQGDTYNVAAAYGDYPAGTNWAWTGAQWDALGGEIDLSQFATKDTATTSADGLMSAIDKAKLDGVEAGANNYTLPTMSADTRGGAKLGSGLKVEDGTLSLGDMVTDSCDGPIYSVDAEGWSEQVSTVGKNLLDFAGYANKTSNGVTYTNSSDGLVINGTATSSSFNVTGFSETTNPVVFPAGTYTLSFDNLGKDITVAVYGRAVGSTSSTTLLLYGASNRSFTLSESNEICVIVNVANGVSASGNLHIQLESGSTATEWEPYSGSKPSPSPEYPQEIRVARGRNLLDAKAFADWNSDYYAYSSDGLTVKRNDGAEWGANNRPTIELDPGTYTISTTTNNVTMQVYNITSSSEIGRDTQLTFTLSAKTTIGIKFLASSYPITIEAQLELGSTPTPYVPYGHVGLEVRGKNIFDGEIENGTIDSNTGQNAKQSNRYRSKNYIKVIPSQQYFVSKDGIALNVNFAFYTSSKAFISTDNINGVINIPANTRYARFWYDDRIVSGNIQIEIGAVPTPYVPYCDSTTPIPLPSKGWAGGLPDGTADELAIDSAGKWEWTNNANEVVFDGSSDEGWSLAAQGRRVNIYPPYPPKRPATSSTVANAYSNRFIASSSSHTYNGNLGFSIEYDNDYTSFSDGTGSMTVEAWKTWLSTHNLTVLYPLATPTTEHGYVDLPLDIPEGSTITIPELENTNARCFVHGAAELAIHAANWGKRNAEMESRLAAVESALAELATA